MGAPKILHPDQVKVIESAEGHEIVQYALDGFKHILQSNGEFFESEKVIAERIQQQPDAIFNDPVGIVLGGDKSVCLLRTQFSQIHQKVNTLNQIRSAMGQVINQESFLDELMVISDEMLTNAIYNAPFVNAENKSSGIARNIDDERLKHVNAADFFVAHDQQRLMIGCIDHYGKLNIKKLLERIKFCYDNTLDAAMNMSTTGGAGIGTFLIYNSSMSLVVGVLPNKKTIFCSLFPLKGSNRARQTMPKSLHLIY